MILFAISIPIMVLAVAIATVPLLAAMRVESGIERAHARPAHSSAAADQDGALAA